MNGLGHFAVVHFYFGGICMRCVVPTWASYLACMRVLSYFNWLSFAGFGLAFYCLVSLTVHV